METFSLETRNSPRYEPERYCGISPLNHMRVNAGLNVLVLCAVVGALLTPHWFSYSGMQYSLTGVNVPAEGGWQKYSDFKENCTEENLEKKPSFQNACEFIRPFEFAGVVCLVFLALGLCLQCFNIISVTLQALPRSSRFSEIDVKFTQFTHIAGPITYGFALAVWVTLLKVAFLSSFLCAQGFIVALTTVGVDFGVALHYRTFKGILKPPPPVHDSLIPY